jgi:hypothetical protein
MAGEAPSSSNPPAQALLFEYHDLFLGRLMVIPDAHRHQIVRPLQLITAAPRFLLQRGAALHSPLPSVNYTQGAYWPSQRVRVMFGCTAAGSRRLVAAPAALHVNPSTAARCHAIVLYRVMSGYYRNVQARLPPATSARLLVALTSAAANSGRVSGSAAQHHTQSRFDFTACSST